MVPFLLYAKKDLKITRLPPLAHVGLIAGTIPDY
jgi:hypothetical protein